MRNAETFELIDGALEDCTVNEVVVTCRLRVPLDVWSEDTIPERFIEVVL